MFLHHVYSSPSYSELLLPGRLLISWPTSMKKCIPKADWIDRAVVGWGHTRHILSYSFGSIRLLRRNCHPPAWLWTLTIRYCGSTNQKVEAWCRMSFSEEVSPRNFASLSCSLMASQDCNFVRKICNHLTHVQPCICQPCIVKLQHALALSMMFWCLSCYKDGVKTFPRTIFDMHFTADDTAALRLTRVTQHHRISKNQTVQNASEDTVTQAIHQRRMSSTM